MGQNIFLLNITAARFFPFLGLVHDIYARSICILCKGADAAKPPSVMNVRFIRGSAIGGI